MPFEITFSFRTVVVLLTAVSWFVGIMILGYNSEGRFKHTTIMGLVGFYLNVMFPIFLLGCMNEGWFD